MRSPVDRKGGGHAPKDSDRSTLVCLNIPLVAQSASRLNKAKPLASLEKKIKENLEAAAAESAALKIPENRVFLYFRVVAEETKSLARSDFDRAMTLAGRFGQTELRVYAELHAIQGVSSEQ